LVIATARTPKRNGGSVFITRNTEDTKRPLYFLITKKATQATKPREKKLVASSLKSEKAEKQASIVSSEIWSLVLRALGHFQPIPFSL